MPCNFLNKYSKGSDKIQYLVMINFYSSKDTVRKMRRQTTDDEKILKKKFDKRPVLKI